MYRIAATFAAVTALAFAPGAHAQATQEICPHVGTAPNPSCITQPLPGEGWIVSGVTRADPAKLDLYRSLVPAPYVMHEDPMVAFIAFRLDVPGIFSSGTADPDDGYGETSVMIRVRNGGESGWFPLATPVNDQSQYDAGRWVGIPKWLADLTLIRSGDTWTGTSTVPDQPTQVFERVSWSPTAPTTAPDRELASALTRFAVFDDPMFTTVKPWDVPAESRYPERVKFTISAYVPEGPRPEPQPGTAVADVSHTIGPDSLPRWRDLVPEGPQAMPGMFWRGKGVVYVSSERADGSLGPPGDLDSSGAGPGGRQPGGSSGEAGGTCHDGLAPRSRLLRRAVRVTRRGVRVSGRARDRGCAGIGRVDVSVARRVGARRCRFLTPAGRLGAARDCRRPRFLRARGNSSWRLRIGARLPLGRYWVTVRVADKAGNAERRRTRGRNLLRLRVR